MLIHYLPNPNAGTLLLLLIPLWIEGRQTVTALVIFWLAFFFLLRFRFKIVTGEFDD